ncbi:hypothetical protein GDO78_019257 [Eleutherodactylus coqui]|uniref:Uncharacterized protein n=1 Tax=Eleutherodactylus coqui TaxID=57060 RepID=A0A8J6BL04_ELECQ|nr:hypothetical protein GDO78_019257 [Eleutherodactylus coqui]
MPFRTNKMFLFFQQSCLRSCFFCGTSCRFHWCHVAYLTFKSLFILFFQRKMFEKQQFCFLIFIFTLHRVV